MRKKVFPLFGSLVLICALLGPLPLFSENAFVEDAQFQLAKELFQRDRYEEALIEFRRLLTDMGSKQYAAACYYYIGSALFQMKGYIEAEKNMKIVIERFSESPYSSPALYLLGRLSFLQGRLQESIGIFDRYVKNYPTREYADNSLYWKAEALLGLGERSDAKDVLQELLERYPKGNKVEAARFKLRLLELQEQQVQTAEKGAPTEVESEVSELKPDELDRLTQEVIELKEREKSLLDEIDKLNDQLSLLTGELEHAKEIESTGLEAQESQLLERINALISWENILRIKEQALAQKEKSLKLGFEKLKKIESTIE
ncbi:MAG: hypothetical protein AMS17_02160 [Spirochaetes bacterium DG_61]|nr:MAG: hypothetical protein AMS17_02160 [Spirochaetes bacterium DG_61]